MMSHYYRQSGFICEAAHPNSFAAVIRARINCPLSNIPGRLETGPIDASRYYSVWTSLGFLKLPGGKVKSRVGPDGLAVTNHTAPLHIFRGVVRRDYARTPSGDWVVATEGTGHSRVPGIDRLNEKVGPKIFAEVDRRCAEHVRA